MQLRVLTKQLRWHDTLALLDVELIHKLIQDNAIPNALSRKKEFHPIGKTFNQDLGTKGHLQR
jgi:hypothetical protein